MSINWNIMLDDNLFWLINWYNDQCNGVWEKSFGIQIETLGNPGWYIKINIQKTELQNKIFKEIRMERTENDWFFCRVENGFFEGNCGTFNLIEVLQTFRNWSQNIFMGNLKDINKPSLKRTFPDDNLLWLIKWYDSQCDGYWEGSFGIQIENLNKSGWDFSICIRETELEHKKFQEIHMERIENDWLFCKVKNGFFEGSCGTYNLEEMLQSFKNWAEN